MHLDSAKPKSKQDLLKLIDSLQGEFSIRIDTYQPLMSSGQRGYYRGYLLERLSEINGDDRNVWHKRLAKRFLTVDYEVCGKRVETVRSTASLTIQEAEWYYSQIRRYAYEKFEVVLRLPNEYGPIDYGGTIY